MTPCRLAALALALGLPASVALAQTTPAQQNPLRPANTRPAPAATAPATQAPAAEAPKPRRQRSEAQLANDNRMRACGQEWQQNKAQFTQQGKTWRVFNVECRARLKAQGR
jgi:hypothetical protein